MSTKIVHIIESGGGTVEFIFLLAKYSPEVEHVVYCGDRAWADFGQLINQSPQDFPTNLKLSHWKGTQREINPIKDLLSLYDLIRWIRKQKDFLSIHLHSSKAGFIGRLALWILGEKKVVYTTQAVAFIRQDISIRKKRLYIMLEKWAYKLGGVVVCSSESEKNAMLSYNIKAITIPNGTELYATPDHLPIQAGTNTVTVTTVGRITTQKNPTLFNNIARYYIDNPKVKFVWAGDGELRHVLTSPNILITGWLTRHNVRKQLLDANIYLSTAGWEGMPYAVLEAMALAKPLVLSDCIGNIDLVEENKNGFIYSTLQQAIKSIDFLLENRSKMEMMGKHSYHLCTTKYDFKIVAEDFLKLYSSFS